MTEHFTRLLGLFQDRDSDQAIIENVTANIAFRGANFWALVFSILVASVGLNVNSTAVVIGAMLISPLMGPIMGIGLGVGTFDFSLIKKAALSLGIATVASVLTSGLYFWLSPLKEATAEITARTSPTLFDVLIAFFGGLAGMVGSTTKIKGNVIPGVAIATALMPPLCTVGFELSQGNWPAMAGAMYLFFINSIMISLAALIVVRLLGLPRRTYIEPGRAGAVTRYVWLVVMLTVLPSVYLAYRLIQETIFERNAKRFLKEQFDRPQSMVLDRVLTYHPDSSHIRVYLLGQGLSADSLKKIRLLLPAYELPRTRLTVVQGADYFRASEGEKLLSSTAGRPDNDRRTRTELLVLDQQPPAAASPDVPALLRELRTLRPDIEQAAYKPMLYFRANAEQADTLPTLLLRTTRRYRPAEEQQLKLFLQTRLQKDTLMIHFYR